jgi:hypothetical protein
MRVDDTGGECPATLGEYRDMVAQFPLGEASEAVAFLDEKIRESGRDDVIVASDEDTRVLLVPLCLRVAGEMRWFGPSWGAPVNEDCQEAPVPIGTPCMQCGHAIAEGDQGVLMRNGRSGPREGAWHRACVLVHVLGPRALTLTEST